MAKISTYPSDNNPSLSDRLIGSDAESSNATKNYSIFNVLDVIGDYYADAGTGPVGYLLTSNGSGNAPTWQPNPLGGYVPYVGATTDVDLGASGIIADFAELNYAEIQTSLYLGLNAEISLDGNPGSLGDIMISSGPGVVPQWKSQNDLLGGFVPYTGATGDVDLDSFDLSANNINANDVSANTVSGDDILALDFYEDGNKLTSYASAVSLVNQTQTSVGVAKIVEFETGAFSDTATVSANLITFNAIGKYMIEVTARVEHLSGGGDAVLNLWLQYIAAAVPLTRQTYTVANAHTQTIRYTFLLSVGNPADAIRVYWSTSNIQARFSAVLAGGIFPASPSTMINVYKIG